MIDIHGSALDFLPLAGLERVRDLEHFDGPLLSHFRHRRGDHYLYYWCDCDDQVNRWMMLRVSETNIIRLTNRYVPLDYVIPGECQDDFVYFVDLDAAGRAVKTTLATIDRIPDDYIPEKGVYLDYTAPKDERFYSILIEKALTIDQLREFPTKYAQAYAFLYVLDIMKPDAFYEYPWRGGFSSMHFYHGLVAKIPGEMQPSVKSLQYASPGFVRFSLHRPTAVAVANCVGKFWALHTPADSAFDALRSYISENKLNDLRDDVPDSDPLWEKHNVELTRRTENLMNAMGAPVFDALMGASQTKFGAARIAYSFGRRIRELASLVRQGLIKLPT